MILKEMPCQAAVEECQVPSKIAKEIDDERQRDSGRTVAGNSSSSRSQKGRSTGPVDRRAQYAQSFGRSTGPVDRSALTAGTNSRVFWVDRKGLTVINPTLGFSGSTVLVDRKRKQVVGRPSRSTDSRVLGLIC